MAENNLYEQLFEVYDKKYSPDRLEAELVQIANAQNMPLSEVKEKYYSLTENSLDKYTVEAYDALFNTKRNKDES